jgi:hypothetical protein
LSLIEVPAVPTERAAFGTRDSFIGMESPWGTIKAGKADTPYKKSTAKFDPFASTLGDYKGIMGNTGGDLRAEFDWRAPHAVWHETPIWNGFQASIMASPGQRMGGQGGRRLQIPGWDRRFAAPCNLRGDAPRAYGRRVQRAFARRVFRQCNPDHRPMGRQRLMAHANASPGLPG